MNGEIIKGNVVKVPENLHAAYHLLFGCGEPNEIARILNETWIDQDYKLVVVKR